MSLLLLAPLLSLTLAGNNPPGPHLQRFFPPPATKSEVPLPAARKGNRGPVLQDDGCTGAKTDLSLDASGNCALYPGSTTYYRATCNATHVNARLWADGTCDSAGESDSAYPLNQCYLDTDGLWTSMACAGVYAVQSKFGGAEPPACSGDPDHVNTFWDGTGKCLQYTQTGTDYWMNTCGSDGFYHIVRFNSTSPTANQCTGPNTTSKVPLGDCFWTDDHATQYNFQCDDNLNVNQSIWNACGPGTPTQQIQWDGTGKCVEGPEQDGTYYQNTCGSGVFTLVRFNKTVPTASKCQGLNDTIPVPLDTCVDGGGYHFQMHCDATSNATESVWSGSPPTPPPPPPPSAVVNVTMRDGNTIYSSIYYPEGIPPTTPTVTVLSQCPYDSRFGGCTWVPTQWQQWLQPVAPQIPTFSSVLVYQESRGSWRSDPASFDDAIMYQYGAEDTHDTVEWIKKQPWSNGVVIIDGLSAGGISAYMAGNSDEPFSASRIGIGGGDVHQIAYRGGVLNKEVFAFISGFLAGPADGVHPDFTKFNITRVNSLLKYVKNHPAKGGVWNTTLFNASKIVWPNMHVAGWYDLFDSVSFFDDMVANSAEDVRDAHTIAILPLGHCGETNGKPGAGGFTPLLPWNQTAITSVWMYNTVVLPTFYNIFNGSLPRGYALLIWKSVLKQYPARVWYVMGSAPYPEANYLASGKEFPTANHTALYMADSYSLSPKAPSSTGMESYTYDPENPAPSIGGHFFYDPAGSPCGPNDMFVMMKDRKDFVLWEGDQLTEPLRITGAVSANLVVSSSAVDTDFFVRLLDIWDNDDGSTTYMLVADGSLRMRWRNGNPTPDLLNPGRSYNASVDLWQTSWVFASGHRVGFMVTSSASPAYDVNPNNGLDITESGPNVTAVNSIHVGPGSFVTLPVVAANQLNEMKPLW